MLKAFIASALIIASTITMSAPLPAQASRNGCSAPANRSSYMTLKRTGRRNRLGNPLYRLCLYSRGRVLASYYTVTGRSYTQRRNRHRSGTQAPLPDGVYGISKWYVRGTHSEVGGRLLPIYPRFRTGRTALGIHYDPSFGRRNGKDGTAGCIGLTNRWNLDQVLRLHNRYRFRYIYVDIL
ncbi:MAG: L,D-transpeptidase [Cyanobacteria bacterium J06633_8]